MSSDKHWFIAIIANNTEIVTAEKIGCDHEVYLPTQKVISVWKDGRRRERVKILLPGKLLIHCTDKERLALCKLPSIKRFMVDIATLPNEFGRRKIAVVPDDQIDTLKYVLGTLQGDNETDVEIDNEDLAPGEEVRIIHGPLEGLEGVVTDYKGSTARFLIRIDHLGCASVQVNLCDVERK